MAKATGATKAQKPLSNKNDEVKSADIEDTQQTENSSKPVDTNQAAAPLDETVSKPVAAKDDAPAIKPQLVSPTPLPARKDFDFDGLVNASLAVEQQLQTSADSFAAANQRWTQLSDHLVAATTELHRLRGVEVERDDLAKLHTDAKALLEKTDAELQEVKVNEAKANDRATKFEEICETIKERAFEIHAALQKSRVAEQDAQSELTTLRSELTELKRVAQDDAAARIVAEGRNKDLQATIEQFEKDDAEARDRIGKLVDDNKALAGQVPQLLSERDALRKQFSASERENARMLSERRVASDRISDLESEIVTLRGDLGSLTSATALIAAAPASAPEPSPPAKPFVAPLAKPAPASAPTSTIFPTAAPAAAAAVVAPAAAPAVVEELRPSLSEETPQEDDDLDLVASLDLAFSEEDLQPATVDEPKRTN